ncbi:MAG: hypothetical protein ACE5JK_03480, partial [Candidatus Omnitrophota bacterium]
MSEFSKLKITKIIAVLVSLLMLWQGVVWANPDIFKKDTLHAQSLLQLASQEDSFLKVATAYLLKNLAWIEEDPYYRNLYNIEQFARDAIKRLKRSGKLPKSFIKKLPSDVVTKCPITGDVIIDLGAGKLRYFNPNISQNEPPDSDPSFQLQETQGFGKYLARQILIQKTHSESGQIAKGNPKEL